MKWHYEIDDRQHGPVELAELLEMLRSGKLDKETLVWHDDMGDWTPASRVKELVVPSKELAVSYGKAPELGLPKADYGNPPEVFKEEEKIKQGSSALAIISLVSGILAIPASCSRYIGIALALIALITGYMYGRRGASKGKASTGRLLGWLALIASLVIMGGRMYLAKHPELLEKLIQQSQQSR